MRSSFALVVVLSLLLAGCATVERGQVEITESDILGSWTHEFDDGTEAVITLNADGSAALVDVPAVLFLPVGKTPEMDDAIWGDGVTGDATWLGFRASKSESYPQFLLQLPDDGHSTVPVAVDTFSSPLHLFFRYGDIDDAIRIRFDRVE